jgi:hypothetical protein
MADGQEVAKIVVVSTDTYDNLEPYFPTIPKKEGYNSYWEDIDAVYLDSQKAIYINAYYVKVQ